MRNQPSSQAGQNILHSLLCHTFKTHKLTLVSPEFKHPCNASWLGSNATTLIEINKCKN